MGTQNPRLCARQTVRQRNMGGKRWAESELLVDCCWWAVPKELIAWSSQERELEVLAERLVSV